MNKLFQKVRALWHLPPPPSDIDAKKRVLDVLAIRQERATTTVLREMDDIAKSQFPLEELIRRMRRI